LYQSHVSFLIVNDQDFASFNNLFTHGLFDVLRLGNRHKVRRTLRITVKTRSSQVIRKDRPSDGFRKGHVSVRGEMRWQKS
jgi:hypothetical protein